MGDQACIVDGCDRPQHHARRGLCRSCYQAHWKTGTLDRYPLAQTHVDRPQHDCDRHPEPCNACSAVCGCRCEGCRQAHTEYERLRRRLKAYGRWQPYVDAVPVREHLRKIMKPKPGDLEGVGRRTIARQTGVPANTIRDVLNGRQTRLAKGNADRLLAYTGSPVGAARVSSAKARAQVAEMVDAGFTPTELARYVTGNVKSSSAVVMAIRDQVTAAKANAIAELHARWAAGEIVPRGRRSRWEHGPPSPVPATTPPPTCEDCGEKPFSGGRWCWDHYSARATPAPPSG